MDGKPTTRCKFRVTSVTTGIPGSGTKVRLEPRRLRARRGPRVLQRHPVRLRGDDEPADRRVIVAHIDAFSTAWGALIGFAVATAFFAIVGRR